MEQGLRQLYRIARVAKWAIEYSAVLVPALVEKL